MPVRINPQSDIYGFPAGMDTKDKETVSEFPSSRLFEDGAVAKNMERTVEVLANELVSHIVPTYVKYPDRIKPEEEHNQDQKIAWGAETPYLNNHIDREGDNPAEIDQATAEGIVRQLKRIEWAAKSLIIKRTHIPEDIHPFEQQRMLEVSESDAHEEIPPGEDDAKNAFFLYKEGKAIDSEKLEDILAEDYAHVDLRDIIGLDIAQLRNMIARQIERIENILPNDDVVISRLRAMAATANYDIESEENDDNFSIFRCDIPGDTKMVIKEGVMQILLGVSNEDWQKMQDSESKYTVAHNDVTDRCRETSEKAATILVKQAME